MKKVVYLVQIKCADGEWVAHMEIRNWTKMWSKFFNEGPPAAYGLFTSPGNYRVIRRTITEKVLCSRKIRASRKED